MLRLLLLAAVLVATAPTADAQLGRLVDRVRGGGTPAIDAESPATLNGRPAPILDYTRFLNMRYWPERGMFHLNGGKDHLIFPPEGLDLYADNHGKYVIRTEEGREVASQQLGNMLNTASAAFLTIGTRSAPQGVETLEDGTYVLDLIFRGQVASRIPFSVTANVGDDPFDPKTIHRLSGPWSQLAYFEHETERTDYHLTFNAWVSAEELGADRGRVMFTLLRDGRPVASSRENLDPFVNTDGDWGTASTYLVTYDTRDATNSTFFTIADVTPGAYVMRVTHHGSGEIIREYDVQGGSGTLAPHPRSANDYEPRHSYLNPRRMGGSNLNRMYNVFWVAAAD